MMPEKARDNASGRHARAPIDANSLTIPKAPGACPSDILAGQDVSGTSANGEESVGTSDSRQPPLPKRAVRRSKAISDVNSEAVASSEGLRRDSIEGLCLRLSALAEQPPPGTARGLSILAGAVVSHLRALKPSQKEITPSQMAALIEKCVAADEAEHRNRPRARALTDCPSNWRTSLFKYAGKGEVEEEFSFEVEARLLGQVETTESGPGLLGANQAFQKASGELKEQILKAISPLEAEALNATLAKRTEACNGKAITFDAEPLKSLQALFAESMKVRNAKFGALPRTRLEPGLLKAYRRVVADFEFAVTKEILLAAPPWLTAELHLHRELDQEIIQHYAKSVVGGIERGTRVHSVHAFYAELGSLEQDRWVLYQPPQLLRGLSLIRYAVGVWAGKLSEVKSSGGW